MTARGDQIVDGYLAQLEIALGDLSTAQRAAIVEEVRTRIARARASLPDESYADVFRLLDQIGDPAAAGAQGRAGLPAVPRTGWREVLAIAGLILVWPAGVVLLWLAPVWSTRAKLIGTLLLPGGYLVPLIETRVVLDHPDLLSCTTVVGENGRLISSNCSPLLQLPDGVITVILTAPLPWAVLTSVSIVYLAVGAWRSIERSRRVATRPAGDRGPAHGALLRLGLVLDVVAGLAVAMLSVSGLVTISSAPGTARGDQAVPSVSPPPPSVVTVGAPALSNLTLSQFRSTFNDKGFSCDEPVHHEVTQGNLRLASRWATTCQDRSGFIWADSSDDHTIDMVTAIFIGSSQDLTPERASQLFDTVVQGVCPPADAEQINAWAHSHMEGRSQTDIDGYNVSIFAVGRNFALTIARSR